MDDSLTRFYTVLSQIPEGRVCSYGHLAKMAELSGARQSCHLLRKLPEGSALPWYRIVNAQGKLANFAGAIQQRRLLESEGVIFTSASRIPKHYFL
ncbi:MAG: methylated-DNA-protein-cysteine methyltransferase-like protein [Kiritimatiellia bacterium]